MNGQPIEVVVAEDHRVVREGLCALLRLCPDFALVGEVADGPAAVDAVDRLRPRVLLLDFDLPGMNGAEVARKISKQFPAVAVVMISCHADSAHIRQALDAGALAYVTKMTAATGLCDALRCAARGERYLGPIARKVWEARTERDETALAHSLTPRQAQVLRLIAEGHANKQIAAELSISIKTVEKHRQEVMDKLGIHNTAGLTRYAIEFGMVGAAVNTTPA